MGALKRKGLLEIILNGKPKLLQVTKNEKSWEYQYGDKKFNQEIGPEEIGSSLLDHYRNQGIDAQANLYWIQNHKSHSTNHS